MKFYANITCSRVIEIDSEDYESAVVAANQQISALLPEHDLWKSQVDVSAVRGLGDDRYYVYRQSPRLSLVRARQLEYQAGPERPGTHPTDPIIRSFEDREDAHQYARTMNEVQRKLDQRHGRWTKPAVIPQGTGEITA